MNALSKVSELLQPETRNQFDSSMGHIEQIKIEMEFSQNNKRGGEKDRRRQQEDIINTMIKMVKKRD